jgi:SAM-dependent methyltransferase
VGDPRVTEDADRRHILGEHPEAVERIAPDWCDSPIVKEHIARYRWAVRHCRGARVLDVACGTGYGAAFLSDRGARSVVAVDISLEALRFARARYAVSVVCADALRLPLASGFFDVVVSLETIEHLSDAASFVAEVSRVIVPGGSLLLSTPNAHLSDGTNPHHLREFTLEELRDLLLEHGFARIAVSGQHWRLHGRTFSRVKGLRRMAWELERRNGVWAWPPTSAASPQYWCVVARKTMAGSGG